MRPRTDRRARQRAVDKEHAEIQRELAARGLTARAERVNREVSPASAFFWRALKGRVAVREMLTPLRGPGGLDVVRDIAMKLLADSGIETAGLVLKVEWHPPYMWLEAVPEMGAATEAIAAVRATASPAVRR